MFLGGRVQHALDEKNRIRIPAKFRDKFPEKEQFYFVAYSPDCIAIMSEEVLRKRMERLDSFDPGDEEYHDAAMRIASSVEELTEDKYGRAAIPKYFLDFAGIDKKDHKDIVSVGVIDYIEIWEASKLAEKDAAMSIRQANKIVRERKQEVK